MTGASASWETLIPATRGCLPSGEPVQRTDPAGDFDSRISIMGVYPAARVRSIAVGSRRMNLPDRVERVSFEPGISASSNHLDRVYLDPLGLSRKQVLLFDLMPFFLANTRSTGGRSMAGNVRAYEEQTRRLLGIEPRPPETELVRLARSMPGNVARLENILARSAARLLLTLGSEAAAFVRGGEYGAVNNRAKCLFYQEPVQLDVLGIRLRVVHLAHPGLLMTKKGRTAGWVDLHQSWCQGAGRTLVASTLLG